MLHQETVETKTLELLATLQNESLLKPCRLVGGTSLALQIAHRKSTDLDLFTTEPFDFGEVFNLLSTKYGLIPRRTNPNTIIGFIGDIKIDVITPSPIPGSAPRISLTSHSCPNGSVILRSSQ